MIAPRTLTSVRLQVGYGVEQGLDAQGLLNGSGITLDRLQQQSDETIEAEQELRVVENLCAQLGDPVRHGLAMGQRYHLSSYGVWGFALLTSPTFGDALRLGVRYLGLTFAFLAVDLAERGEEGVLMLGDGHLPESVRPYLLARDASAIMVIQQELFSERVALSSLRLRLPAGNEADFVRLFGRCPDFDEDCSEAAFALEALARPLPQANPLTARLCEEQCDQLLASRYAEDSLAARVRRRLLQQTGQFPDAEAVAGEMGMTSRTLRRRLKREGTCFRALLDEVRRMLAEQWLQMGVLTMEEISDRLGFSELSNFNHAFRRWTGQTPARFRRGVREGLSAR